MGRQVRSNKYFRLYGSLAALRDFRNESSSIMGNKSATSASGNTNRRLFCLAGGFAFWFSAICVRLFWLQVVAYGDYSQQAARQQQRSIEVPAIRGNIYDRNGNELAMTAKVDSVFAVPSEITNIHKTAVDLARALNTDADDIETRLHA